MACSIKQLKEDGVRTVKRIFKGEAKSITFKEDTAIIKYGYEFQVKDEASAYNMVQSKIEKINKWSAETFKTTAFKGQWTRLYQNNGELTVEFTFPPNLVKAYERKFASEDGTLDDDGQTRMLLKEGDVSYQLAAVNILTSDKAKQVFSKGNKNNWELSKILTELQIPKAQKQIILDKGITDREEIVISLLAENTFTVETKVSEVNVIEEHGLENLTDEELGMLKGRKEPSRYYTSLTVPGGTKYRENEISTPAIIPNIKGHASFSTDQGIGWFRSDEQGEVSTGRDYNSYIFELRQKKLKETLDGTNEQTVEEIEAEIKSKADERFRVEAPTRRILEVQSDLFQKGRDKKDLTTKDYSLDADLAAENFDSVDEYQEYLKSANKKDNPASENKFLQLLNRKGNWVNFFIQSIVQDSAKKGYKKVLFPTGETAAKVEGHQTIAEDINRNKEEIKYLEESIKRLKPKPLPLMDSTYKYGVTIMKLTKAKGFKRDGIGIWTASIDKMTDTSLLTEETTENIHGVSFTYIKPSQELSKEFVKPRVLSIESQRITIERGIEELKQNVDNLKTQGVEKLKPIEAFYKGRVTNILNKLYKGRIEQITDEHGNTWNEVELKLEDANTSFILQMESNNNKKTETFSQKFIFGKKNKKEIPVQNFNTTDQQRFENLEEIKDKIFGGALVNTTANQVLRTALYNLDLNEETQKIVKTALISRAKVVFVNKDKVLTPTTVAQYNPNTREIQLNMDVLGSGNTMYAFESILHEVMHDLVYYSIQAPKNDNQRAFRDELFEVYSTFHKIGDQSKYGFKDIHEFTSEIMSNEVFRDHLRTLDYNLKQTFIQKIWEAIKRLFGINTITDKKISQIMDSILNVSKQEYENNQSPLEIRGKIVAKETEESKKNKYSPAFNKELNNIKGVIKDILSRIDGVKARSRAKKGYSTESQKKFNELQELMEELYNKSASEALYEFTNFANSEIEILLDTLDTRIDNGEITADFLTRAESYASVYSSLEDISSIAVRQYDNRQINKEEYDKINESLKNATSKFNTFNDRYIDLSRDLAAEKLAPYNSKPIASKREELEREYIKIKPTTPKEDWINNELDKVVDELKQEALEQVRRQLEFVPMDVSSGALHFNTEKNIDNLIVQLISGVLDKVEMEARDFSINQRNDYYNQAKEYGAKGSNNKKKFAKLLSQDKEGNQYLIGRYKPEFIIEYNKQRNNINDVNDEFGYKSKQSKVAWNNFMKWKKNNLLTTYDDFGIITDQKPIDKWLDKRYDAILKSPKDLKYLNFLKTNVRRSDVKTEGYRSLIQTFRSVENIQLPRVRKSDMDRLLSGNFKSLVKDNITEITDVKVDDITRGEVTDEEMASQDFITKMVSINNEERLLVPIFYRNRIKPIDQSLDLPTIFLLNDSMSEQYKLKMEIEADIKLIRDVIGESQVTRTEGGIPFISGYSKNLKDPTFVKIPGKDSNLYRKFNSMVENRMYSITQVSTSKFMGKDISQIANGVAGYSAHLALMLNILSAAPNLAQGKIQNFIEGVGKNTYTRADLRWAEATYWKEIKNGGLNDIGTTTNNSKLSMLLEKFNATGDFSVIKNAFEDQTKLRSLFKTGTLHGMNTVAEHYIQSTIMLATMKAVKIKNAKGDYINNDGKVVSKKDAMNLYDAYSIENGKLELNNKADHSSFTKNKFSKLGTLDHQNLIRKKIIDAHGQYDTQLQSDIQRYWWGKLIFMFRKWLVTSYMKRWRGISHTSKDSNDLTDNQKFYDSSLKEFQEGMYTSFLRFLYKGVLPSIKEFKIELAKANWDSLLDREKANIHKTLRELLVMTMMWTGGMITYVAAKDAPDEDDAKMLYFLAYMFKRQETELMQYYSPADQMRIFRTPFAAMSTVEKVSRWMSQMAPWNIGEKYEQGKNKGEYKAWIKSKKLIPVISQTTRSSKDALSYLKNISD